MSDKLKNFFYRFLCHLLSFSLGITLFLFYVFNRNALFMLIDEYIAKEGVSLNE